MSENKWTPGPWLTKPDRYGSGDVGIFSPNHHKNVLAEVFCELRYQNEGANAEAAANANLIAASPAMAEALEEVDEVLESLFRHSDESAQRLIRKVKAALSLARGEAK